MELSKAVTLEHNQEHLETLIINNTFARASISLYGGHILSFTPKHDGRDRLWLSNDAVFDDCHSIRGGIPVCWPWFGDHKDSQFQSHGYVRTQRWQVIECRESKLTTIIKLSPEQSSGPGFEGSAKLTMTITIGQQLKVELTTENTGCSNFEFNCALHSYFNIDDITNTELQGISGDYSDKTQHWKILKTPKPYIFNQETDRIHLTPSQKICINLKSAQTSIESHGHDSIVVWNPWSEKSLVMADMTDDGYLTMLCVETAITQGKVLPPGQKHHLIQIIS